MKKGFTLIELLVVIAVIGMLASIVLVSFKGTRERASLAKIEQFASSVHHALGAYAVGIWTFDEGVQGSAKDTSGYRNNGTVIGATLITDRNGQADKAYNFSGATQYIDAGASSTLIISDNFTYAAWVKADTLAARGAIMGHFGGGGSCGGAYRGVNLDVETDSRLWVRWGDTAGNYQAVFGPTINTDTWYHIVLVFSSSGGKIYVNGAPTDISVTAACASSGWAPFQIGKNHNNSYYWDGIIDEARVYNQVFTTAEIQQMYAESMQKYQVVLQPQD